MKTIALTDVSYVKHKEIPPNQKQGTIKTENSKDRSKKYRYLAIKPKEQSKP